MENKYNVFGIGNALVDVIVFVEDNFLEKLQIQKGMMTLVDLEKQKSYLSLLKDHKLEMRAGGSVANSIYCITKNCEGTGIYAGKVTNDKYGNFYKEDMKLANIVFNTPLQNSDHTGICLVLVTPDSERTMLTNLGAATQLTVTDIDFDLLKQSQVVFLEGYLWDTETLKKCSINCMENAKKNNLQVAFTYSDAFCIERARDDFIQLSKEYVDMVFCNLDEAKHISQEKDKTEAIKFVSSLSPLSFITDGENGVYLSYNGKISHIEGFRQKKPIDTTGAGDCFAGGVLYGLTHHFTPEQSCKWANLLASKVIMDIGGRIHLDLSKEKKEIFHL